MHCRPQEPCRFQKLSEPAGRMIKSRGHGAAARPGNENARAQQPNRIRPDGTERSRRRWTGRVGKPRRSRAGWAFARVTRIACRNQVPPGRLRLAGSTEARPGGCDGARSARGRPIRSGCSWAFSLQPPHRPWASEAIGFRVATPGDLRLGGTTGGIVRSCCRPPSALISR